MSEKEVRPKKKPKKRTPLLPLEIRKQRTTYVYSLFAQGVTLKEVNKKVVARFGRALSWTTYRKIEAEVKENIKNGKQFNGGAEALTLAVQPVKQVSERMRNRLRQLVSDMRQNGVERIALDSKGSVEVQYTPAEQMFDLNQE